MTREPERIAEQLRCALDGPAWHGPSLHEALRDVPASQAARPALREAHSIWEIVLHLTAWHEAVRRRLGGERVELTEAEDWPGVGKTGEAAWAEALERLADSGRRLGAEILRFDPSRLEEAVPGKEYSFYVMLQGVVQHDLYHAGQIVLLKRAA